MRRVVALLVSSARALALVLTLVASVATLGGAQEDPFAPVAAAAGSSSRRVVKDLQTISDSQTGIDGKAVADLRSLPSDVTQRLIPVLITIVRRPARIRDITARQAAAADAYLAAVGVAAMGATGRDALIDILAHDSDEFVVGPASDGLTAVLSLDRSSFPRVPCDAFVHLTKSNNIRIRMNGLDLLAGCNPLLAITPMAEALRGADGPPKDEARGFLLSLSGSTSARIGLEIPVIGAVSRELARSGYRDPTLADEIAAIATQVSSYAELLTEKDARTIRSLLASDQQGLASSPTAVLPRFAIGAALKSLDDSITHRQRAAFFKNNLRYVAAGLIWLAAASIVVALWWFAPVKLRAIDRAARSTDIKLPSWLGGASVPLRALFLINVFAATDRVLDAWVAHVLPAARRGFEAREIARSHAIYVPLAAKIDDNLVDAVESNGLRKAIADRPCVLIVGEGGVGKTTLSCQIARWTMSEVAPFGYRALPALIDSDLASPESPTALIDACRGQVQALIDQPGQLDAEFFQTLLARRRIVVIIDGLSELKDDTRKAIRPGSADFLPAAFVVTSRVLEQLDGVPRVTINPVRVDGTQLSTFIDAYLVRIGKKQLFEDREYFSDLSQLSEIVRQGKVTALFAKLFADVMVATKQNAGPLPTSIPDLMSRYVFEVKRNAPSRFSQFDVEAALRKLGWLSLKDALRPRSFRVTAAADVLGDDAQEMLRELKDTLGVIEVYGFANDERRFTMDPLAEYFAAAYVADRLGSDIVKWKEFMTDALARADKDAVKAFCAIIVEVILSKDKKIDRELDDVLKVD